MLNSNLLPPEIPLVIFQTFGAIVVALLLLFIIGGVIYAVTKKFTEKAPAAIKGGEMPLLRPVPIPTKNRGLLMRVLVWIYDVRKWELAANWEYQFSPKERIVVPKGFKFDGASIPRVLWSFLNPIGLLLIPGLLHDYGYRYRQLWKIDEDKMEAVPFMQDGKKKQWDLLFWRVGKQVNGTRIINLFAFLAVYFAGHLAWKNNRKREMEEPITRPVIDPNSIAEYQTAEQLLLDTGLMSGGHEVAEHMRNPN